MDTMNGEHQAAIVGIFDLQVIVAPAGKSWIAQAVQLDYAACGDSEEDAKKNFEEGLHATIQENLNVFGDLDRFLKSAPMEDWLDLAQTKGPETKGMAFSQVSVHFYRDPEWKSYFPFERILFSTPRSSVV